jgi:Transposase DDE domain
MASTIPEVAQALRSVLSTWADEAARDTRFVQRRSKLTGAAFVQTLTFGWLANPEASLEELTQTAATVGVTITPQGLDQRFTPQAADCLRAVVEVAVTQALTANAIAIPILQRFSGGVYLLDSTTLTLPDALAQLWPGSGRNSGPNPAALKLQVRLDLLHGLLSGPFLQPARDNDHQAPLWDTRLPAGALHLADLGYFDLDRFAAMSQRQVYWLTRIQPNTRLYDEAGHLWTLPELIAAQTTDRVDLPIALGSRHRLPARLVAVRVPPAVATQRRQRMRKRARGKRIDPGRWALAEWTVYATNIPTSLLTLAEVLVIARCRWQIELLFKLWKQEGRIDESRSNKPWRILCEVYGKLLGMVVQHWVVLVSCWSYADRSLVKASRTLRGHALHLATALKHGGQLVGKALEVIQNCLSRGCRVNKRRKEPATYQLLLNLTGDG